MLPTTTLTLPPDTTLLLDGPASVRLKTGNAACLQAPLAESGAWLTVRSGRRVPVEALSSSKFELRLGAGGSLQQLPGSTIPGSWREASQIVRQTRGRTVILGSADSGKSTLSNLLLNDALASNLTVGLVDGDIGQADIGPPATINGATVQASTFDMQTLLPQTSYFVGDTSPAKAPDKIWEGLAMVQHRLSQSEVLIINTDGWLDGLDAYNYKQGILERLEPTMVLGISSESPDENLDKLLDSQKCSVLKLEASKYARRRSREERKRAREAGYRRFLKDATRTELDLARISLRRFDSNQTMLEPPSGAFDGVLSGLLDRDGMLVGICRLLETIHNRAIVETAVREMTSVRTLELGAVILSADYEEIGFSTYM